VPARSGSWLPEYCVCAQGELGQDIPVAEMEGHFDVRIDIQAADVACVEVRIGAIEISDRGAEAPIDGREGGWAVFGLGQQRLIHNVETQAGQVQDAEFRHADDWVAIVEVEPAKLWKRSRLTEGTKPYTRGCMRCRF